ncbi:MAG: WbqC family protein [Desulfobacterales bacterium]|nr:WbqC family protein [Desulfobacterales bacterium]
MVLLDDVQFPLRTTWTSRNRLKNDQGALWTTIPVWEKGPGLQRINQGNTLIQPTILANAIYMPWATLARL